MEAVVSKNGSQRPANVLIVSGIFPPDIGGPATYVPAIGAELVKRGYKVTVVTLSDALGRHARSYPFRVVRLKRRLFKPIRFLITILTLLRWGNHSEVLFVNGLYLEATIANLFLRKPLVQKVVGDWAWERATNLGLVRENFEEFQQTRYDFRLELLKSLRTFCTRRADMIIVPSYYLARWVAEWGVANEKLAVIYNATEPLNGIQPARLPLTTDLELKVVTVGRLVPWKQVDHVIEAIADCDDAGLVIIGDGPERDRLERLVRRQDLAERIYFAGHRNKQETLSLMSACDLFVLNSTYEGFPHVVLEAMSVGLPVVATAVGGTPELVHDGENGVLIPPNANGALSGIFRELLSSPAKREQLAMAAKRTVERYQQSEMIEKAEAVLRACARFEGE